MTIILPALPRKAEFSPRPVRGSSILRPAFGGPRQPVARMGDHWAIDVDAGVMPPEWGFELLADLMQSGVTRVAIPFPEAGIDSGTPGAPVVDGAGQSGMTLLMRGFRPGYAVRKGKFFSAITNGQRFLSMARTAVIAGGDGRAAVPIWPMLRRPHADGDVIEMAQPMIEGFVDEPVGWSQGLHKALTIGRFVIEEVE